MDIPVVIAFVGLFIECVLLIVAGVWVIGKLKTESALNRASATTLKESLDALTESNRELTQAIRHIDNRVTVLETLSGAK